MNPSDSSLRTKRRPGPVEKSRAIFSRLDGKAQVMDMGSLSQAGAVNG